MEAASVDQGDDREHEAAALGGVSKDQGPYIEEGWGIYDDSADMDRAIVMSDAYYGDGSSVVELCLTLKMPAMLQNVEIL